MSPSYPRHALAQRPGWVKVVWGPCVVSGMVRRPIHKCADGANRTSQRSASCKYPALPSLPLLPPPKNSFVPNQFALSQDGTRLAFVATDSNAKDALWIQDLSAAPHTGSLRWKAPGRRSGVPIPLRRLLRRSQAQDGRYRRRHNPSIVRGPRRRGGRLECGRRNPLCAPRCRAPLPCAG